MKQSEQILLANEGPPMTPIISKIHLCPTCDAPTVWCRDAQDPTKAFCCRCGEIEVLAEEALLD